jgi:hypothetical protein
VSVQRGRRAPVPRHQLVDAARWIPAGHTFEHVGEVGEGFDVVELGGGDEGANRCPALSTAIGSREQMVLRPSAKAGSRARKTSAAGKGASIFKMPDVSRHKSVDTLRGYVRDAGLFKDHAGAGSL